MTVRGTVLPPVGRVPTLDDLDLRDLEAVRLLLRGESVVDWHNLAFGDHADVDRFLRLNEFDPDSDDEMGRLEDVRADAVDYLTRVYGLSLPDEIAEDVAARDLFLIASRQGPLQRSACVVLKVMHIIHHVAGRQAMIPLSVSDELINRQVELKVLEVVEQLRAAGAPISEFEWSRKSRDSVITKLIAKRSTLAANIYDKLRFRIIVPNHADLVPVMALLMRQLFPFNYVVPGESVNQLVDLGTLLDSTPHLRAVSEQLQRDAQGNRRPLPLNEFSGPEYRIINFVADLPLRLARLVPAGDVAQGISHVIFVLTEFQLADKATALRNESGQSSHEAYKARQHDQVRRRLMRREDEPPVPD